MTQNRRARLRIIIAAAAATALILLTQVGPAWAVRSPFGIATPETTGPAFTGPLGGFFAWVALYQAEFYKALTQALGGIKHSGHAFALLAGVSFLYGIFHAVGPGHGKTVITSYLLVSRQTVKRGIVITFAAALMQGLMAIGVVLIAAAILNVTAVQMTHATDWFEIISYVLVTAVGAWLLWVKTIGRRLHRHAHAPAAHCDHDHAGHALVPDARLLSKPLTVSRAWAATLAVGIRPCSGAIIVLVFALSQKLLVAGIGSVLAMSLGTFITVSTLAILAVSAKDVALRFAGLDSVWAERIMHVVEIGGALLVLLLGLTLLGGALDGGLPT
jgi:nickel/cobalt transporter (NicO) family protein